MNTYQNKQAAALLIRRRQAALTVAPFEIKWKNQANLAELIRAECGY